MHLSNASSKYGASMGRASDNFGQLVDEGVKVRLQHVRLNSGGYDSGGAYWGRGAPLYRAQTEFQGDTLDYWLRAGGRLAAKQTILKLCPKARFYR